MNTKPCPFCAEEIQEAALVCRHCGKEIIPDVLRQWAAAWSRLSDKEREEAWMAFGPGEREILTRLIQAQPQRAAPSRWPYVLAGCGLLIVLIGACAIFQFVGSIGDHPVLEEKRKAERVKEDAWYTCTNFVRERLKAPSTAEFCPFKQAEVTVAGDRYSVRGCVDSENSFGAKMRTAFHCELHEEGNHWRLRGITVK